MVYYYYYLALVYKFEYRKANLPCLWVLMFLINDNECYTRFSVIDNYCKIMFTKRLFKSMLGTLPKVKKLMLTLMNDFHLLLGT